MFAVRTGGYLVTTRPRNEVSNNLYPTIAEVLTRPVIRDGSPRLVAGLAGSGHRVRWVHAAEVADIGHLLRGGELVLTAGIALPAEPAAADATGLPLAKETRFVEVTEAVIALIRDARWRPPWSVVCWPWAGRTLPRSGSVPGGRLDTGAEGAL